MEYKYCKNCKHYTIYYHPFGYVLETKCIIQNGFRRTPVSLIRAYRVFKPEERNKNNNCEDYARKWYKFWVRP